MAARYAVLGTLDAVASEYGLTRERVRQILKKGHKKGLFRYQPYEGRHEMTRDEMLDYVSRHGFHWSRMAAKLGFTQEECSARRREWQRKRAADKYRAHAESLGYPPTDTWLQANDRALSAYIRRIYGGVSEFYKSIGVDPKRFYGLRDPVIRAKGHATIRERNKECVAAGICLRCKREKAITGRRTCPDCYSHAVAIAAYARSCKRPKPAIPAKTATE